MSFYLEFLKYFNQYRTNILPRYRDRNEIIKNENLRASLENNNLEPTYKVCINILDKILINNHPKFLIVDKDYKLNNDFFIIIKWLN